MLKTLFPTSHKDAWNDWNANPAVLEDVLDGLDDENLVMSAKVMNSKHNVGLSCPGETMITLEPGQKTVLRRKGFGRSKCVLKMDVFPDMDCKLAWWSFSTDVYIRIDTRKVHVTQRDRITKKVIKQQVCGSFSEIVHSSPCKYTEHSLACFYHGERWTSWFETQTGRFFPKFSETGYKLVSIPPEIWNEVNTYWKNNRASRPGFEGAVNVYISNGDNNDDSFTGERPHGIAAWLPNYIKSKLNKFMREEIMNWVGVKVKDANVFGIREYLRGAQLQMHVDRYETHVLSGTIFVGGMAEGDEKWPLQVWGHDGKVRDVSMNATHNLILYESATGNHGRPMKFEGVGYAGVYAHYQPDWWVDHSNEYEDWGKTWDFVEPNMFEHLREFYEHPKADIGRSYMSDPHLEL